MDSTPYFAIRGSKAELEEGLAFAPKFDVDGLIPALAMDALTREPLMLAYMNAESLRRTLQLGEAVYWSRSHRATSNASWKSALTAIRTRLFCLLSK